MKPIASVLLLAAAGCQTEASGYTLYRSSATGPMRIHVASFDTKNGEEYNRENCDTAAELFRHQPSVTVRYWCEKGSFRS